MSDVKRKAVLDLGEIHRQACYEVGDHPDEIDTAYSIGADAIDEITALRARLAEVEAERNDARNIADHDKALWLEAVARAERAEAALATARRDARDDVLQSVGEMLAGTPEKDVSPAARGKIRAAIIRAIAGEAAT